MKRGFGLGISLAAVLILLLAVNVIASMSLRGSKLDLTEEHLFTLSDGTKKLIARTGDKVTMKLFYSKSAAAAYPQLKQYAERVIELLHQYENASGGKIKLEVLDPQPDTETEEYAVKYGIQPMNFRDMEASVYLGLVMLNESGRDETLPVLSPDREGYLEYDVSRLLDSLETSQRKRIGIMTALPATGGGDDPSTMDAQGAKDPWVFVSELKKQYDVEKIPTTAEDIDKALDLLLVIHPKDLSDKTQFAIDQYILGGGHAVIMVDPLCYDEMASFQSPNPSARMQTSFSSNLPKLFKAWGISMDDKEIVGDADLATMISTQRGPVKHPTFLTLTGDQANKDDVASANIESIFMGHAGALKMSEDAKKNGLKYTWLLRTTKTAGTTGSMTVQYGDPSSIERDMKSDGEPLTLAMKITGKFKTAFPEGKPAEKPAEGDAKPAPVGPEHYLAESDKENSVIVFSDVDMATDNFSVRKQSLFGQMIIQPINDNVAMLANASELLLGAPELVDLRTRGKSSRPFTMVNELQKEAQAKWKDKAQELEKEQEDTIQQLNQLQHGKSEASQAVLSASQEAKIQEFREKLAANKKDLREVRRNLRESIEALGTRIKIVNVGLIPILVLAAGFIPILWRHRRMKRA